jgi:hypothetical protein
MKSLIIIGVAIFFGCSTKSLEKKIIKENRQVINQIQNVKILMSRGGRAIRIGEISKDSIIPEDFMDEIYCLELNNKGKLTTYFGFGSITIKNKKKNLFLNEIIKADTIYLQDKLCQKILKIANRIYSRKEYFSDLFPTDSWLIKLQINDKTNIYHDCEFLNLKELNKDYIDIVNEIVKQSIIKVDEW